ncbi:MAG: hypothetical protein OIN83_08905 [Candidatus Methanoperedens sp.]|nr:hypothetical protein [Candidatus Methanoperedens sp.]
MRFSSEKDFIEQIASYDISEKIANDALKELINKGIVEKRRNAFYLLEEQRIYE